MSKEIIAMLLAGGRGSRMGVLTKKVAKPAVLFGGWCRLIDFSLSNCINSGIDTVGILAQYQPSKLNTHPGIGEAWGFGRMYRGVTILFPHPRSNLGEGYNGTANAVFQNIDYISKHNPRYVAVLSGDHIYKMDYSKMLEFHKKNNADFTVSVIHAPLKEADRYGILDTDEVGRVSRFEEKPIKPKSTLASMGVYIFTWEVLREYLLRDNEDGQSDHDFGKNIIPSMLKDGRRLWAYKFNGYWRDVGTVQAFWESNMDVIKGIPGRDLFDPDWRFYTTNPVKPTYYIMNEGSIKNSIVAEGCTVLGKVRNSVVFPGVFVESGAVIEDSILMPKCYVGAKTYISHCIAGEKTKIGVNIEIGVGENVSNKLKPSIYNSGITVIGEGAMVPDGIVLGKNVMVDVNVSAEDYGSAWVQSGGSVIGKKVNEYMEGT